MAEITLEQAVQRIAQEVYGYFGEAPKQTSAPAAAAPQREFGSDVPSCPICGGDMYDNRKDKKSPKAPDFKCKNGKYNKDTRETDGCQGVIWAN